MGTKPDAPDGATERGREVEGWLEVDPVAVASDARLGDVAAVSALEVPGGALEGGPFSPRK